MNVYNTILYCIHERIQYNIVLTRHEAVPSIGYIALPSISSFHEGPHKHNRKNGVKWGRGETLHLPVCAAEVLPVGPSQVSSAHVYSIYIKVEQRSVASSTSSLAFSSPLTVVRPEGESCKWITSTSVCGLTQHTRLMADRLLLPAWSGSKC